MDTYGEILFLGRCNLKCFYCLSNEMHKLKQDNNNQLNIYFLDWNNFEEFIIKLKNNNIKTIYLSSVVTDPLLYKYINELVVFLQNNNFKVGIRTNGYLAENKIETLLSLNEEISFSINSLNEKSNYEICKIKEIPNWDNILNIFRRHKKKCRITIVINEYNYAEIFNILDYLNKYSDVISYVQLRKIYKYNNDISQNIYFDKIKDKIQNIGIKQKSFYESQQYIYNDLKVSLWEDVFKKESISSINYFTNGIISTNNLLIPTYEKGEII